jgi:hypothetical protein
MSSDNIKGGNTNGGFEHEDVQASSIIYFLLALGVMTVLCLAAVKGFYAILELREKPAAADVNPLVKNVPWDTRHITPGYPQTAFPNPRLEEDERNQLNGILTNENNILYSYGWVDEKAGTVRIPIERAMDLLVQHGLPVLPQVATGEPAATKAENNAKANAARGVHGKVNNQ